MPTPTPVPALPQPAPTVGYILAVLVATLGLFATQGWITNGTEKLVTGLAVTFVPLGLAIVNSLHHARVKAAIINAQAPHNIGPGV